MVNHLERPAFLDETSIRTNMARTTGRAPRGERLVDHAPFRRWRPRTFIDALRHDRLGTPWGIDGAMSAEMSGLYVGTQLLPTLRAGDVFGPVTRTNGVRGSDRHPGQRVEHGEKLQRQVSFRCRRIETRRSG